MEDEQRDRLSRRPRKVRKGRPSSRGIMEREDDYQERADRNGSYGKSRLRREALDESDFDYDDDNSNP